MTNKISTPLYKDEQLSRALGVNLYIKREDLFPIAGGGNKGRKADYILGKCLNEQCTAVVTCGGLQSNHTRATAIKCKELGLKCTIIIHSEQPVDTRGNYKILKLLGVRIVFCSLSDVAEVMDNEMAKFVREGEKPFYIWGGGHCVEGSLAYYDLATEVISQADNVEFDFVFHASGTGTTQAGLHCGFRSYNRDTRVIGISVARDTERGRSAVIDSSIELCSELGLPNALSESVEFDDNFTCGGYEKYSDELLACISEVSISSGLILDPTYTAKAFLGLKHYVDSGTVEKKSNVLFIHTGGLLNFLSSDVI